MIVKPFKPLLFLMRFLLFGGKSHEVLPFYISFNKNKRFPSSYDLKKPKSFLSKYSLSCKLIMSLYYLKLKYNISTV